MGYAAPLRILRRKAEQMHMNPKTQGKLREEDAKQ
jgi:hypothetical protein